MSYEKQTWTTGDTITAEKLNHIENGIENNGTLVVNTVESGDIITLDKTWQEIYDAFPNVYVIYRISSTQYMKAPLTSVGFDDNIYGILIGGISLSFSSNSPNDYPSNGNNDDEGETNPK